MSGMRILDSFILLVVELSNSNKPKITGVKMVMINYAGVGG